MQLIGIANIRPGLFRYLCNSGRIENSCAAREIRAERSPQLDCAGAPFLKWRIIKISIWIRVENLMRKRRRLCIIDRDFANAPGLEAFENVLQSIEIHGLMQAVVNCFFDK